MVKDLTYSILFMLLAIWLVYDEYRAWNDNTIQKMGAPFRKYIQVAGAMLLFIIGLLYLLDTLGFLH